jgi:hypothetical protein
MLVPLNQRIIKMQKLTKKLDKAIDDGKFPKSLSRKWNSGARFDFCLDWDAEDYIISASEVAKDLNKYLAKWPGLKKFHVKGGAKVYIEYVR